MLLPPPLCSGGTCSLLKRRVRRRPLLPTLVLSILPAIDLLVHVMLPVCRCWWWWWCGAAVDTLHFPHGCVDYGCVDYSGPCGGPARGAGHVLQVEGATGKASSSCAVFSGMYRNCCCCWYLCPFTSGSDSVACLCVWVGWRVARWVYRHSE